MMMSPSGVITGMPTQVSQSDLIFIWIEYELACNKFSTINTNRHLKRFLSSSFLWFIPQTEYCRMFFEKSLKYYQ